MKGLAMEHVRYEVLDDVGVITLDSPANRNALSAKLVAELLDHLETSATDSSHHVLLRSAGTTFCSGADLREAVDHGMSGGARAIMAAQRAIVAHPKPVIASVAGAVRAGGLGLIGASDVVICADDVTFAFTEARLGLTPAVISATVLRRLTDRAASDTFLTGRTFDAHEAEAMGLVTRSVRSERLNEVVQQTSTELRLAHPQGLCETKALLNQGLLKELDNTTDALVELSARLFDSPTARAAFQRFLGKD